MLLVTGASGFLGRYVVHEALTSGHPVVGAAHRNAAHQSGLRTVRVDLTAPSAAQELLEQVRPTKVINCAAFTNVDECERSPDIARLLNVEVPRMLAAACARAGVSLVHISTDSVFDGKRGNYSEEDEPAPVNEYARSKLDGERAVQEIFPEALVIRTNFIGASESGKAGLADWITSNLEAGSRIDSFDDVVFSPLLATEVARLLFEAVDSGLHGLYHASAADSCSKYELARRLSAVLALDSTLIRRASLADASMTAARPLNTSLSSSRIATALGRLMPSVDNAVSGYAALHLGANPKETSN